MTSIYAKVGGFLLAVLLIFGALYGAYDHGRATKDAEWQSKWNDRDTRDEAAALTNETAERDKEQARQHSINKAIQDGQQIIDKATSTAAAADSRVAGLQGAVDQLTGRLAASEASGNSCIASASKAADHAARVLADVFKLADQAAGIMAAAGDQARARGLTCEQAYDGIAQASGSNIH